MRRPGKGTAMPLRRYRVPPLLGGAVALALAAMLGGTAVLADNMGELVDRTSLRVCADPSALPFSNERGEGFENKIAELMAQKLGVPLVYTWYPQTVGFVRNTLRANRCDLIIGVVAADELVQNTNPYYRSSYVLVHREGDAALYGGLDLPTMQLARIGVIAGTPAVDLLVARNLIGQTRPYQLLVDSRYDNPPKTMLDDLAGGQLDAALLWGPIAGYYASREPKPLTLVPLAGLARGGLRLDYRISMGIRQGEPNWKHKVNELIKELQPQITAILADYGVPQLDEQGRLIGPAATPSNGNAAPDATTVPEPAGYRMDKYRAPVPATLQGATVLTTPALVALLADKAPVVVDVLPKQRKPKERTADQVWVEPAREHIAGSVWLPNVGYGELSQEFADYFREQLARLTDNDKSRPVVFYCDANCWMSWNAAKRAMTELGYTSVYWYPEGVQGWKAAGQALAEAHEVPMPDFIQ